jgi:hypothetical protein
MKSIIFETERKVIYDLLRKMIHEGATKVPNDINVTVINRILGDINKKDTNVVVESTKDGLYLKKVGTIVLIPTLRQRNKY